MTASGEREDHHKRYRLLGAMALGVAIVVLPVASAWAQAKCTTGTRDCALANDQYTYLESFASLPTTAAGHALLNGNLSAIDSIYQNATTAQRNQAALNAVGDVQNYILRMISNSPLTAPDSSAQPGLPPPPNVLGLNASSFQNGSAGVAFLPLSADVASTASLATALVNNQTAMNKIDNVAGQVVNFARIGTLKDSFSSYNTWYYDKLKLKTAYATSPTISPDMRPFLISTAIANAPWSSLPASQQPWLWAQQTQLDGQNPNSQWLEFQTSGAYPSGHSTAGNTTALVNAMVMPQAYQSLMVSALQWGLSRNALGVHYPLDIIGGRVLAYYTTTQVLAGNQLYAPTDVAASISSISSSLNSTLGPLAAVPYAGCAGTNLASCVAGGVFPTASQLTAANQAYVTLTTYGLQGPMPASSTNTAPANSNLLINPRFPYLNSQQQLDVLTSTLLPAGVALDDGTGWARLNLYAAAGGYGAFNNGMVTVNMNAAQGGFSAMDFWSNNISGTGGLSLTGSGTLVLGGNNTYIGGTFVGCPQGNCTPTLGLSGSLLGNLTIYPGGTFVSGGLYSVSPTSTLSNGGTFQSVSSALSNQGTLINSGQILGNLANAGIATNVGTITGNVANSGIFANDGAVNGFFANSGLLSGTGTVAGSVVNSGMVSPGNSIGTMTIAGNYTSLTGSTYAAEINGSGQSDRINVVGPASLQGGTVQLTVVPGSPVNARTTYTLLNATGGLTGTFAGVNQLYPFLQSNLSYDASNVYLTMTIGGFAAAAQTPTQYAVGVAFDGAAPGATGDFANILGTIATLNSAQVMPFLTSISGQNYSAFSNSMVQGAQLFMNNFALQVGRGSFGTGNGRVALAEACDVACQTTAPALWGAWGGALGGTGTVGAGTTSGSTTYNVGGFAGGLDRLFTPNFLAGVTVGYTTGTQWVSGFSGQSATNTVQAGVYGSFFQGPVYLDGMASWAYSTNQMWRNIAIPNLQQRTAQGLTGANQFFGQLEGGYRIDLGGTAMAFITPFARMQGYTGTQNGFTETGAQSLSLTVASQTTNSLRSVIGAQLGGSMDLGWRDRLYAQFRLGWSHEYADVSRPVTASLVGAPSFLFTTYGSSPQRDGAVVGVSLTTAIANASSLYLRYEGNIAGQDTTHALTAGLRMTW